MLNGPRKQIIEDITEAFAIFGGVFLVAVIVSYSISFIF